MSLQYTVQLVGCCSVFIFPSQMKHWQNLENQGRSSKETNSSVLNSKSNMSISVSWEVIRLCRDQSH